MGENSWKKEGTANMRNKKGEWHQSRDVSHVNWVYWREKQLESDLYSHVEYDYM